MNKLLNAVVAIMLSILCVAFTACGDDNDEPEKPGHPEQPENPEHPGNPENPEETSSVINPSNVFTGLMPTSVGNTSIVRNSEGLVSEIRTEDGKIITFEYPTQKRAAEETNQVKMTVIDDDVKTEYDMTVNSNGFVNKSHAKITSGNPNEDEEGDWTFTYDNEGHLTNATHIYTDVQGDGSYSVTLQWKDGNIIKTLKDEGWDSYTYAYTSSDYPKEIENKGALFMFEDIYPVEIYEFEWVYYAGMLGKGPKSLAVSKYENDDDEIYVTEYIWKLDQNGYPTSFDVKDDDHPGTSTVKFNWN